MRNYVGWREKGIEGIHPEWVGMVPALAPNVHVAPQDAGNEPQMRVGIGYGDDIGGAKQVILEAMRDAPGILGDPAPKVLVAELGDFAVQLDVLKRIKPAQQQAGVDLPFPTTQVLFHDQTEASDGDRTEQREGWPARDENPRARWRILQESASSKDGP